MPTEGELRLHLGCGSTVVAGWVNIDRSPNVHLARAPHLRRALRGARLLTAEQAAAEFPRGIVRADVTRGLPFPDGSARFVYTSHMIEHVSRWQALALVREIRRVLALGGLLRVATPDLEELVGPYANGSIDGDTLMARLGTFRDEPGTRAQRVLRRVLSGSSHQWLYDERSLGLLLREGGLVEPVKRAYREGECPDLDLLEHRPESLILETRRP